MREKLDEKGPGEATEAGFSSWQPWSMSDLQSQVP